MHGLVPADQERIVRALKELGARTDAGLDLMETALLLGASDRPDADLEAYRHHLQQMAGDLAQHAAGAATPEAKAAALAHVVCEVHGYGGDGIDYDDPCNANLLNVIDRRRGLPVAIGIIFLHAGRAQDWRMRGLAFPGHFLVDLQDQSRLILDPLDRGRLLDAPGLRRLLRQTAGPGAALQTAHTMPVSDRQILIRLLNNIKSRAIESGDHGRALQILSRLLLIAPNDPEFLYEFGVVGANTGNLTAGLNALQCCLQADPPERIRALATAALQKFKPRLN